MTCTMTDNRCSKCGCSWGAFVPQTDANCPDCPEAGWAEKLRERDEEIAGLNSWSTRLADLLSKEQDKVFQLRAQVKLLRDGLEMYRNVAGAEGYTDEQGDPCVRERFFAAEALAAASKLEGGGV